MSAFRMAADMSEVRSVDETDAVWDFHIVYGIEN